jgi:hypothetical protein
MATTTAGTEYASELALAELPWMRLGIDEDVPFSKRMKATSLGVQSNNGAYYIQTGMTGKIGYPTKMISSEGTTAIPAWLTGTHVNPKWSLKEFGNQVRVSTIGRTQGQLIGETSISSETMKNAMAAIAFFKNRVLMGSPCGMLCRQTSYVDANTITVDDMSAIREGLVVDGYDALTSGSQGINSKTISLIDPETGNITITGHGGGATDTDWLFFEDQYSYMPDGLLSMVAHTSARTTDSGVTVTPDVATYAGLTRSSTSKWTSFAKKLPNGAFNPKYWPQFCAEAVVAINGSQASWTACYGSLKALAALSEALEYDKKSMGDQIVYGTNKPVSVRSIYLKNSSLDLIPVSGFGDHKLVFCDETQMGIRAPAPGSWVGAEGGNIWTDNARETTGYPTWTAAWLEVCSLIGNPFAQAILWNFDNL